MLRPERFHHVDIGEMGSKQHQAPDTDEEHPVSYEEDEEGVVSQKPREETL